MDRRGIGERLRTLRGDKTISSVSKDLSVTDMAVSLWERGERVPSDDMKVRIAAYYGVPVYDLFFAE